MASELGGERRADTRDRGSDDFAAPPSAVAVEAPPIEHSDAPPAESVIPATPMSGPSSPDGGPFDVPSDIPSGHQSGVPRDASADGPETPDSAPNSTVPPASTPESDTSDLAVQSVEQLERVADQAAALQELVDADEGVVVSDEVPAAMAASAASSREGLDDSSAVDGAVDDSVQELGETPEAAEIAQVAAEQPVEVIPSAGAAAPLTEDAVEAVETPDATAFALDEAAETPDAAYVGEPVIDDANAGSADDAIVGVGDEAVVEIPAAAGLADDVAQDVVEVPVVTDDVVGGPDASDTFGFSPDDAAQIPEATDAAEALADDVAESPDASGVAEAPADDAAELPEEADAAEAVVDNVSESPDASGIAEAPADDAAEFPEEADATKAVVDDVFEDSDASGVVEAPADDAAQIPEAADAAEAVVDDVFEDSNASGVAEASADDAAEIAEAADATEAVVDDVFGDSDASGVVEAAADD
ncbi:MAG: hypothetical protein AB8G96_07425, partial [Phycisphaerales bacterium]